MTKRRTNAIASIVTFIVVMIMFFVFVLPWWLNR